MAHWFNELAVVAFAVSLLVFLNGFFVAAEFALVKVRRTQLMALSNRGNRRAQTALDVVSRLDAALSATQLGITLTSLGLGYYAEPAFAHLLDQPLTALRIQSEPLRHLLAFLVGFSCITFLHIVLGELAPKTLAIQRPVPTSLWVAGPLAWFERISFPIVWALNGASMCVLRRFGIHPAASSELHHSEEEMRLLLASTSDANAESELGRKIVLNAFDLRQRLVREVMRPRHEIVTLDTSWDLTRCLETAERTRYSRFPLSEAGDVDRTVGILHIKDLYASRTRSPSAADLRGLVRRIVFVPPNCRMERLLALFLERKLHFAFVVDEFGGTLGIVTLENLLEALVGQIQDEFDQENPLVHRINETEWDLDGALSLHELESLTGLNLETGSISTLSGFVTQRLGGFASDEQQIAIDDWELRVSSMDGLRVAKVRLRRLKPKL